MSIMDFKQLEEELLYTLDKAHNLITKRLITDIISGIHSVSIPPVSLRRHEFGICYSEYGYYPQEIVYDFANEVRNLAEKINDADVRKIFLGLYDMYKER